MFKRNVLLLLGCLMSTGSIAQFQSIEDVLRQIESNNLQLKAASQNMEAQKFVFRSQNNLPDPEIGAYLLPNVQTDGDPYSEMQISQSMEFPTAYVVRSKWLDSKEKELDLQYQILRQEVLFESKQRYLDAVYLSAMLEVEQQREVLSKRIFGEAEQRFISGEIGILELNKAKVVWLQNQFNANRVQVDFDNNYAALKALNGGQDIHVELYYPITMGSMEKEQVWEEKKGSDPMLSLLQQQVVSAQSKLTLAKHQNLPDLTIGYNNQGIRGDQYAGIYGGLTIPLWNNRFKQKSSSLSSISQSTQFFGELGNARLIFENDFAEYEFLLLRFKEYKSTLEGLQSEELLMKSYNLGEISFLEFYQERHFYQEAYNTMLSLEHQLYLSQNKLLKHQL